jgi:acetyl/propionyl-CoA carboxylase alpha subunit
MKRALAEYEVLGIRTTIPFFRWFLQQPAFEAGAFHTGTLDELLQQRQGEPFVTPTEDERQIAALAAELYASRGAGRVRLPAPSVRGTGKPDTTYAGSSTDTTQPNPAYVASGNSAYVVSAFRRTSDRGWKQQGRLEGLRP